jgi:broad specificity phosphatase PhoE
MTTTRVTLVTPAVGRDLREARFAGEGPLDPAARDRATEVGALLGDVPHWFCSPTGRCRNTARALRGAGDRPPLREPSALAGLDVGRWRGRTLGEVSADDPAGLAAWLTDPAATPHGGESLRDLGARVGGWLDGRLGRGGRVLVVAESDVVRAAVGHALALPGPSFWRLDVEPLSAVELSGRSGRWNVRPGRPLG